MPLFFGLWHLLALFSEDIMAEYIKLYFTETEGQVEPVGNGVGEPVTYILRADLNEIGEWTGLYALATSGFTCSGVQVVPSGTTFLKWQLNEDDGGGSTPSGDPEDYGDPLYLGFIDAHTKVYFHVRAKATEDEVPVRDETVSLNVAGIASAE